MVGCNIEKHVPALRACLDSGLFEIAQHTYEHYSLKTVLEESPENVYLPGLTMDRMEEQLARPVELLQKHLGVHCRGITAPYTYYRGLGDRPDILELVARHGMSYVRSHGRNCHDYFPLGWEVQPYWYSRQGFPDISRFRSRVDRRPVATRARVGQLVGVSRLPEVASRRAGRQRAVHFALPARLDEHFLRRRAYLDAAVFLNMPPSESIFRPISISINRCGVSRCGISDTGARPDVREQ